MLTIQDFKNRANNFYENHRQRWRKKLEKGMPKGVKLDIPADQILPYTRIEFHSWLWKHIQLNAVLCPYCRAPMDITSMQIDHCLPFTRGGGPELSNQMVICKRCNAIKGPMTRHEYLILIEFLDGPAAAFRKSFEGYLINGHEGRMNKFFGKKPAKKGAKVVQSGLNFELGEF